MGTRKNKKFNKFNKRFRKTRSKRGGGQLFSQPSLTPICPICRENLNDNCITLECGHKFDKDCLKDWCKTRRVQPSCPMCREPIRRACRELLFTDLEKLLFDAIKAGEIDFVEEALALGLNRDNSMHYDYNNIPRLNIDVINKNGNTPLIIAAANNEDEIVDLLLRRGADIEHLNDDNKNAYQIAIENDNTNVGNKLLEYGYYDPLDDAIEFQSNQHNTGVSRGGKRKTRSKRGGDIESKEDDNFIVTIAIITHGCIIDTDPKQNQYDLRYYSATGDKMNTCDGNSVGRSIYHDDLIEYFRQDNPSRNDNNNTINELPDYFDDIPYDKVIGKSENQGFINDCIDTIAPIFTGTTAVGVWLISVHKEKLIEKNNQLVKKYEYIYPTNKNKHINLFNIEGFKEFNQIIGKNKFNITSELVENNKPIPKKENNIRNFQHWDVELNNTKERINYIRLSYLFDLIKKIAGNNCKLNVYDYTCSINCNDCNNINNNNQEIKQGLITGIEEGKMPFFTGGKRKTRKTRKNRRRRKKAGADTPDSSFDEGHTDRESISINPDEPFHVDIEAIPLANEVHELEMELLDDSFASENPDVSFGTFGSIELDDDNDDDTPDLDASLSLGGKRKTRKSKKSKRKFKRKTRRK